MIQIKQKYIQMKDGFASFFLAAKPIVFKVFIDLKKSFYSESHWVRFATYNTIVTIGIAIQNLYSTILSYFV